MGLKMKRGKSKLLSDTDVKNCLRFINDNRCTLYYFIKNHLMEQE